MSEKNTSLIEQITNKVKALFAETPEAEAVETEMAEMKIKDSEIVLKAPSFAVGDVVTTVTEEGDEIAIPADTYVLEDGKTIITDDAGTITEVIEAEVEVEVEAEKKEEEMASEDKPSFVTQEEFTAAMTAVTQALERVSTKLSAVKVEETTEEKIVAENKLLKNRLAEKRKSVTEATKEKKSILPDNFGKSDRGHKSSSKERVAKRFADFDFSIEKTNEPIDLN